MQQQERQRIGDLLRRFVPLSGHDVDEILQEQRTTSRRFGEVAISMGLCRPEHVWKAWSRQNSLQVERVDLDQIGIDAQATPLIAREVAMRFGVIPVRVAGVYLVVATSDGCFEEASTVLPAIVSQNVKFVIAPAEQIQRALVSYYPS